MMSTKSAVMLEQQSARQSTTTRTSSSAPLKLQFQSQSRPARQTPYEAPSPLRKFLPVPALLLLAFLLTQHLYPRNPEQLALWTCRASLPLPYRINPVRHQVEHLSTGGGELGIAVEAIEELLDPENTVFGRQPFPKGRVPAQTFPMDDALLWVYQKISLEGTGNGLLAAGSAMDASGLGVAATMVGQRWPVFLDAAERQKVFMLDEVLGNASTGQITADAVGRFAPFLAYYAVARNETEGLSEAVRQIGRYRAELSIRQGSMKGLWRQSAGVEQAWSTGNAAAAFAMARVRATITGWDRTSSTMLAEKEQLDLWTKEILDAAIATDDDKSGLLRNYLADDSWFGETSGTALLAATAYRMAVLNPAVFAQDKYLSWAAEKLKAVASLVDEDGFARPVVNLLNRDDRAPAEKNAEGASHLIMMVSAWRDCVCAGVCSPDA